MKAVWLTRFGSPDVLVARPTPDPVASSGEVVVEVSAVSVTFVETLVRAGRMPNRTPGLEPPYVPGNGVAGTVVELGAGVDGSWQGRRVVTTTGGARGYAERVAVAAENLIPIPDGVDARDAAALLADGRTAIGLAEIAAPARDEWVLVEAAAGGVGTLLVQLCRSAGARVIGLAGGAAKLEIVRDLGADAAVDYTVDGWPDRVRAAAAQVDAAFDGVDVVFDGVGGEVGASGQSLLRAGGLFVQFGLSSGAPTQVTRTDVRLIGFEALGSLGARATELSTAALAESAAGRLRPLIGQTFALAEAAAAHAAIESRATVGKTLLIP